MPFSTQADLSCVVGFAPHNAVTAVLNIGVVCGKKGSKFNVTVIILPSEREAKRRRTLLRPLLKQLSAQLLSDFYQKRPFKHDHSNEPISHEIDFSDK